MRAADDARHNHETEQPHGPELRERAAEHRHHAETERHDREADASGEGEARRAGGDRVLDGQQREPHAEERGPPFPDEWSGGGRAAGLHRLAHVCRLVARVRERETELRVRLLQPERRRERGRSLGRNVERVLEPRQLELELRELVEFSRRVLEECERRRELSAQAAERRFLHRPGARSCNRPHTTSLRPLERPLYTRSVPQELRTVLVVDDDASIRLLCRVNLELDGHRVLEAPTVATARELLETERIDVILLDVHVGPDSGLDLLDHVESLIPRRRVVMLSGTSEISAEVRARVDGVLGKPFRLEDLAAAVR